MAIIDNETYGLKGSQVKDLANKVKDAARTFYELTEDDYNWNSDTQDTTEPFNCIALWLLPAGLYRRKTGINTHISNSSEYTNDFYIFVMPEEDGNTGKVSMLLVPENPSPLYEVMYFVTEKNTGDGVSGYTDPYYASFLRHNNITSSMYENNSVKVLSGSVGYNLRQEIDNEIKAQYPFTNNPTTSTVGYRGQLGVTLDEHVFICVHTPTSADPDYRWVQLI